MKRFIYLMIFLICFLPFLNAQDKLEIFGYFESQALASEIKDNFYQLYTNKLRVDLKSQISKNITFAANFDYITYHGKTQWDILEFLSSDITSKIPQGMESFYVIPFSNRHFLDNAYIKMRFKYFDLIVGKQQISLGTGYVWNPTDVFNIKDMLDPTYEMPGHNAMRMDIPLGASYSITALYSPGDNWKDSAKMIQFEGQISHFDYSLIAIEKIWRFHDYTQFDYEILNFSEVSEKRQLLGGSIAGEFLGLGIWAEYGHNKMEKSKSFYELVVGSDYTFDFQTYILLEYYRNTFGKSNYEDYDLNDWMRFFTAEQKTVSRDQIYTLIQHPATDLMTIGLSSFISISDSSFALAPVLNYSLSDNAEIIAYLNFSFGREGKISGKNMGNGGLIRLRIYF